MPIITLAQNMQSPSPTPNESHLTFSHSSINPSSSKEVTSSVKKNLTKVRPISKKLRKTVKKRPTFPPFRNALQRQLSPPITVTQINSIGTVHTITGAWASNANPKLQFTSNRMHEDGERTYPKPACSYSCLIALALRNSESGNMPVCDIYDFLSEHFPFFKTALNGWKNSVRHNLSLNKCFKKIEKPAVNGYQRKSCLWALNQAKISKMNEEFEKWTKTDRSAIRMAMANPRNLELLERGELKFTCSSNNQCYNFGDSCGSAESEVGSNVETENNLNTKSEDIEFATIKPELEDNNDFDIEETDTMYDDMDIEEDKELLRVELALAQKELFKYKRTISENKQTRTYIIQN